MNEMLLKCKKKKKKKKIEKQPKTKTLQSIKYIDIAVTLRGSLPFLCFAISEQSKPVLHPDKNQQRIHVKLGEKSTVDTKTDANLYISRLFPTEKESGDGTLQWDNHSPNYSLVCVLAILLLRQLPGMH